MHLLLYSIRLCQQHHPRTCSCIQPASVSFLIHATIPVSTRLLTVTSTKHQQPQPRTCSCIHQSSFSSLIRSTIFVSTKPLSTTSSTYLFLYPPGPCQQPHSSTCSCSADLTQHPHPRTCSCIRMAFVSGRIHTNLSVPARTLLAASSTLMLLYPSSLFQQTHSRTCSCIYQTCVFSLINAAVYVFTRVLHLPGLCKKPYAH